MAVLASSQPWLASTVRRASGPAASRTAATRASSRSGRSPVLTLKMVTPSARSAAVLRLSSSGSSQPQAMTSVSVSRVRPPMRSTTERPSALPCRSQSAISRPARAAWLPTVHSSRSQTATISSIRNGSRPIVAGPRYSPITSCDGPDRLAGELVAGDSLAVADETLVGLDADHVAGAHVERRRGDHERLLELELERLDVDGGHLHRHTSALAGRAAHPTPSGLRTAAAAGPGSLRMPDGLREPGAVPATVADTAQIGYNRSPREGISSRGALAQLGERLDRTQEVSGSIPLCSTTTSPPPRRRPHRARRRSDGDVDQAGQIVSAGTIGMVGGTAARANVTSSANDTVDVRGRSLTVESALRPVRRRPRDVVLTTSDRLYDATIGPSSPRSRWYAAAPAGSSISIRGPAADEIGAYYSDDYNVPHDGEAGSRASRSRYRLRQQREVVRWLAELRPETRPADRRRLWRRRAAGGAARRRLGRLRRRAVVAQRRPRPRAVADSTSATAPFEHADLEPAGFDAVVFASVLEHLARPGRGAAPRPRAARSRRPCSRCCSCRCSIRRRRGSSARAGWVSTRRVTSTTSSATPSHARSTTTGLRVVATRSYSRRHNASFWTASAFPGLQKQRLHVVQRRAAGGGRGAQGSVPGGDDGVPSAGATRGSGEARGAALVLPAVAGGSRGAGRGRVGRAGASARGLTPSFSSSMPIPVSCSSASRGSKRTCSDPQRGQTGCGASVENASEQLRQVTLTGASSQSRMAPVEQGVLAGQHLEVHLDRLAREIGGRCDREVEGADALGAFDPRRLARAVDDALGDAHLVHVALLECGAGSCITWCDGLRTAAGSGPCGRATSVAAPPSGLRRCLVAQTGF